MKTIAAIVLVLAAGKARAQFGGVVFDPTQSAHAIQQIAQGTQILSNSLQLARTGILVYNLAYQMAHSPGSNYASWASPSTSWLLLQQTANTYGNSQPVMTTANTGAGAAVAYQTASVPRYGMIPEYPTLSIQGQQQVAASGATTDITDAISTSNLTTLGTMRSNEIQREADIEDLEAESQTTDPFQQTDLATMQRINQAALLQVRQGQEANQLQQAIALMQMVSQKQQQDAIKAKFQDAADYGVNFQSNVAPAYGGGAQALTY